jgi:hypothetical protein
MLQTQLVGAVSASADPTVHLYALQNLRTKTPGGLPSDETPGAVRQQILADLVNLLTAINTAPVVMQANLRKHQMDRLSQVQSYVQGRFREQQHRLEQFVQLEQQTQVQAVLEQQAFLWRRQMREVMDKLVRDQAKQKELTQQMWKETMTDSPTKLEKKLTDTQPLVRLAAVQVIGSRRLHLEAELIERLSDPSPPVREAAHQALIRLSRGCDFGPPTGVAAPPEHWRRAAVAWRNWLSLQDSLLQAVAAAPPGPAAAKGQPIAAQR